MAGLTLDKIWLNDAADPTDRISIAYVGDGWQVEPALAGDVEDGYASGRSRGWSGEGDTTTVSLPLAWLTAEHIAWLRAHRGRTLWFRDPRGGKVSCKFYRFPVSYSSMPVDRAIDTSQLTLKFVTASEAV